MSRPAVNNLTMSDGHNLVALAWPWQRVDAPRAHVLLVHGLGEHANRYNALAAWLQQQGISVWAYDQRGHGASDGARGVLPKSDTLLTDLDSVWQSFAKAHTDGAPLLVLGHSMGGLVAMRWLQRGPIIGSAAGPLAAIVSSPVLGVHARRLEQHLARILAQYVPNIRLPNGLKHGGLSHDQAVIQAYTQDPLVHAYISPRLGHWLISTAQQVLAGAAAWQVPLLLMYAGADVLVDSKATDAFALSASSNVQTRRLDAAFHEIFNETPLYRDVALTTLASWLDALLPR
jgi:alpha-beta hydrolase superfamily lysophospholipase